MSRRDGRANAERLVEATCRLWTREPTPSLDAIAKEAGVGVATLYRHYPNRVALERAAFARILSEDIAPIIETGADRELLDVVEEFVGAIARYAPLLAAVGSNEIADEAIEDVAESFLGLLASGQREGLIRADLEPIDLYWLLRMVVLGLTHENSSATVRRRYLAITLAGLTPAHTEPLPVLTAGDYDRLAVDPALRSPIIAAEPR